MRNCFSFSSTTSQIINEFTIISSIVYERNDLFKRCDFVIIASRFCFCFAAIISHFRVLITISFSNCSIYFFLIWDFCTFIRLMRFHLILMIITSSLYMNKSFTFFELSMFSIYDDVEIMFNAFFNLVFNIELI